MDELTHHLLEEHRKGTIDRRELLRWAAVLGLSSPLLNVARASAAGQRGRAAVPVRGGTLRVMATSPASIEPQLLTDIAGPAVVQPVCDYLITRNVNGVLQPSLALSWTAADGGKTWTIKLRPNVKFNNGQPFTAKDVVATFDRLVDPAVASTAASTYKTILSKGNTVAQDDLTVVFNLDRAVVDFPYFISISTYQAAILPADWPGDFAKNPIGTGPFKMMSYQPKQLARYVRNPSYWQPGLPYLDGVELQLGLDAQAQITALLGGSADMQVGTQSSGLPILLNSPDIKVLNANTSGYDEVAMRVDRAPFSDKRVRQALAYCLDRPAIVKTVLNGYGRIANDNAVFPVFPLWSANGQRTQDYAKAKALLAAAGLPKGFKANIVTTPDALNLAPLAIVLQQMLAPAGIQVNINLEPGSTYYNTDWVTVPFDIVDWASRPTPSLVLGIGYRTGVPYNSSHFANKTFDGLLDQLDATLDVATRKAIVLKLENIMTDDTPALIPYSLGAPRALRKNVQGVVADPSNFVDLSRAYLGSS